MNKMNNESKNIDNQDQDNDKNFSKAIRNKSNEEDTKKILHGMSLIKISSESFTIPSLRWWNPLINLSSIYVEF